MECTRLKKKFTLADLLCDEAEHPDKKKPIKVYARVRPLNEEEINRNEKSSVETFDDETRIKVIDEKHSQETTYHFDGVFSGSDPNKKVFDETTKHLITKLLNGMNCAILTYGQTGSGKTYTLMAEGCLTDYAVTELFEKITEDKIHQYKVTCSFVQVYLEKVFDLLSESESKNELPVREHPKKGIYVSDLSHHQVENVEQVFSLFERGKQELITAETKMVRHSSRSHAIFQISIERRLDARKKMFDMCNSDPESSNEMPHLCVPDDILILEEDVILRGKMDICDLAGSERLGKTMVEGINCKEAKYINSSLLELGNVINALSERKKRHIPFRNSTLTRLLQECLGSRCLTSFIVCVAPSASEAYETRCSLNFGTRARTITNKERMIMNVEVDYKILAKKLNKKIEILENKLNESHHITDFTSSSLQTFYPSVSTQTGSHNMDFEARNTPIIYQCTDTIKHAVDLSEMLEILIENNENLHQNHQNIDTLRSSAMMNLFSMAASRIAYIYNNLSWNEVSKGLVTSDVDDFINQCLQKMETVRNEMLTIEGRDKNDLFAEAAYAISEACSDVENMLRCILKSNLPALQHLDERFEKNEVDSFHKVINQALVLFARDEEIPEKESHLRCIHHLLHLMHVLQIVRLMLESSRITSSHSAILPSSKAPMWSISVEEAPSEVEQSTSNEDSYFSENEMEGKYNLYDRRMRNEGKDQLSTLQQNKLNRSHSFKIKHEMWKAAQLREDLSVVDSDYESVESSLPQHTKGRSNVQALNCPKTKHNESIDDSSLQSTSSDSNESENEQVRAILVDLEKRHDELLKKYESIVDKNNTLNEKVKYLQEQKMTLMTERNYAQQKLETALNKRKSNDDTYSIESDDDEEEDEPGENTEECLWHCKNLLKEREEEIKRLQSDEIEKKVKTVEVVEKRDDLVAQKVSTKQTQTEEKESKDMLSFGENILALCNVLDVVNYQDSVRKSISNIEDINQLESELFTMIENNVKYEAVLKDIKEKVSEQMKKAGSGSTVETNDNVQSSKKNLHSNVQSRVTSMNSPMHVTKKINTLKKMQRQRLEGVRKTFTEHPVTMTKELKSCRTSRVKELLQNKLDMNNQIKTLVEEITIKDNELRESKKQTELLVMELSHIDIIELNTKQYPMPVMMREKTSLIKKENTTWCKNIIKVHLPVYAMEDIQAQHVHNSDVTEDITNVNQRQPFISAAYPTALDAVPEEEEEEEEGLVPASELEFMKKEAETYGCKFKDTETMNTSLMVSTERDELIRENLSLKRKCECHEETNTAISNELKTIKETSLDRKMSIQGLKERINNLIQELEYYKKSKILNCQPNKDNVKFKT